MKTNHAHELSRMLGILYGCLQDAVNNGDLPPEAADMNAVLNLASPRHGSAAAVRNLLLTQYSEHREVLNRLFDAAGLYPSQPDIA